ncbi:MAG: MgtC/SapB family protein [Hyphomicrobiales bacterium]|nr:MAG: MgtC/SapB family protein [Hyphomicrobiales bacterium]
MTTTTSLAHAFLYLSSAVVFGAVIGFERQWRQRMAGLRTNTLVALGAATFVLFASLIPGEASPTRVAAQVVSGIGFLGAGLIFKEGLNVRGLNTAATLWCSASIGVLCGAGLQLHAALATSLVMFVNLFLRPLVGWINRRLPTPAPEAGQTYCVSIVCRAADEAHIRALLLQGLTTGRLHLTELESADIEGSDRVTVAATIRAEAISDAALEHIVGRLSLEASVTSARWTARQGE